MGTGKQALSHEGEECGIVLKGHLEVTVGKQSKTLKPGDAYYFTSSQPHYFKNNGREVCELISACTPPSF
jgi:mannose-6-phosphate isomerase-like protein (cupin superfamily)